MKIHSERDQQLCPQYVWLEMVRYELIYSVKNCTQIFAPFFQTLGLTLCDIMTRFSYNRLWTIDNFVLWLCCPTSFVLEGQDRNDKKTLFFFNSGEALFCSHLFVIFVLYRNSVLLGLCLIYYLLVPCFMFCNVLRTRRTILPAACFTWNEAFKLSCKQEV